MTKRVLYLILILIFTSCNVEKNKKLSIELKPIVNQRFAFDELYYSDYPLYSYSKIHPEYYNDKIKLIKGIPKLDSFQIVSYNTHHLAFKYNLYKKGYLDKKKFYKKFHKEKLNDTVSMRNTFFKSEINAISGFLGNKQIVIVDTNNNLDFSDEKMSVYPIDFRYLHNGNIQGINEVDTLSINYEYYNSNATTNINRKVTIYPFTNSAFQYLIDVGIIDEKLNNYTLVLNLKDYFYGKFPFDNNDYNIVIQGLNKERSIVYVVPDSFDKKLYKGLKFLDNFAYKAGDTVNFSKNQFELNFDDDMLRVQLSSIRNDNNNNGKYGCKIGDYISNHKIINLKGEVFELKDIIKKKQLTLLDFWGTWCGPCKKLTPRVKQIYNLYKDDLTILGIAYDGEKKDVMSYIKKNNMKWSHFFVDENKRANTIVDKMNVRSYPTFILVNQKGKILFVGGSNSIDYIEKIIKKQLDFSNN